MARRRRSRLRRFAIPLLMVAGAALGWAWWGDAWPFAGPLADTNLVLDQPPPEPDRVEGFARLAAEAAPGPKERPAEPGRPAEPPHSESSDQPADPQARRLAEVRAEIEAGLRARERGDLLAARQLLAGAVGVGLPEAEEAPVRAALVEIARRSIFSPERLPGDALVGAHVVQAGEVLARIAKDYQVTADLLAHVNGIPDKNRIGLGQRLKVVHGPFNAVIRKDRYQCLVFLQDTLVAEYPVGLGEYGSTPTGEWIVADKLTNPTYYPPASRGGDIIAADDPLNPLGEYWIGLKGVSGEALGQIGYGIHGTIEPETIGTNVSMGCVRLLNEDMEMFFKMLTAEHSHVVIK